MTLRVPQLGRVWVIALCVWLGGCSALDWGEAEEEPSVDVNSLVREQIGVAGPETLGMADKAIEDERFDDAERLLERVFVSDPESVEGKLLVAELRLARGDPAGALAPFSELVEKPEVAARAKQGRGITLLLIGDGESAEKSLREAVSADATLWRAWNGLGAHQDSRGQWGSAEKSYRRALALRPAEPMLHNNLGFSLFMQDRLAEAIDSLGTALRLDPEFDLARTNLRLAFARKGQYLKALSGAQDQNLGRALNNVGYIALLRGDYESAEAYLLRAMQVDPSFNERAWRNLNYLKNLRELEKNQSGEE